MIDNSINSLIPISKGRIDEDLVSTVNARELHGFLESKQDFSTWIKNRIDQYDFRENIDFVLVHKIMEQVSGAKHLFEYHLTIDMAKELAMVERNDRGKQARQYFIDCERRLKAIDPIRVLNDPAVMRGLLLTYSEKVLALQSTIEEQAPTVEAFDRIAGMDGCTNLIGAAKSIGIGPKKFFDWLRANKWIYRRVGGKNNVAYQHRIQQGFLDHKIASVKQLDGSEKIYEQVVVTPKGLCELAKIFTKVG